MMLAMMRGPVFVFLVSFLTFLCLSIGHNVGVEAIDLQTLKGDVSLPGTIYSIPHAKTNASIYILDPKTNQQRRISRHTIQDVGLAQGLATIDNKRSIYYILGYNFQKRKVQLYGMHIPDGNLKYQVDIPFFESAFIGAGQTINVDKRDGSVLLSGREKKRGIHYIMKFYPSSGQVHVIDRKLKGIDISTPTNGFDPVHNVLWIEFTNKTSKIHKECNANYQNVSYPKAGLPYLHAFRGSDGTYLGNIKNELYMETMDFDTKTKKMVGLGLDIRNRRRLLVSLDSKTMEMKQIAKLPPHYYIMQSGLHVLDSMRRTLLVYLAPQSQHSPFLGIKAEDHYNTSAKGFEVDAQTQNNRMFQLLWIQIDNGSVIKTVNVSSRADIPWSMEYSRD